MSTGTQSFLALEGRHVFITGGSGGIGTAAVKEFLGEYDDSLSFDLSDRMSSQWLPGIGV